MDNSTNSAKRNLQKFGRLWRPEFFTLNPPLFLPPHPGGKKLSPPWASENYSPLADPPFSPLTFQPVPTYAQKAQGSIFRPASMMANFLKEKIKFNLRFWRFFPTFLIWPFIFLSINGNHDFLGKARPYVCARLWLCMGPPHTRTKSYPPYTCPKSYPPPTANLIWEPSLHQEIFLTPTPKLAKINGF